MATTVGGDKMGKISKRIVILFGFKALVHSSISTVRASVTSLDCTFFDISSHYDVLKKLKYITFFFFQMEQP